MRARNVKPGLFANEILGEADPLITILFVGLWCAADREGRLEDRPLKLCGQLFPYRRSVTDVHVNEMLGWLDQNGFIRRYQAAGRRLIQIMEFTKHQRPHSNEQASRLPAMGTIPEQPRTEATANHGEQSGEPREEALRSDSGFLIPDSGYLIPDTSSSSQGAHEHSQSVKRLEVTDFNRHERFERCKAKYPTFAGKQDWISAEKAASLIVSNGEATWDFLEEHCELYRAYCDAVRITGTQYVMRPGKFFSDVERPWAQPWTPPQEPPAEDRNQRELEKFLKGGS
jgi:hypothetical protein